MQPPEADFLDAAGTSAVRPPPQDRPWKDLSTIADVEQWIVEYDQDLQRHLSDRQPSGGHGICFTLVDASEIYLHTNGDGDVVLDVSADAAWAAPVITAATGAVAPTTQIWLLPGDALTQLILGLNSLIATSRIVLSHQFRARKY